MKRSFLSAAGAATAAALALLVTVSGPAAAQTAEPAAASPTLSAAGTSVAVARAAGTDDVITCTPNVQNPHNSTHVGGTVNVVVTLKCTGVVPYISIRAALYRNGELVKDSGAKAVYDRASAQNNAAVACSSATYQGWMSYYVEFPAGYSPPSGASSGFGNAVKITC